MKAFKSHHLTLIFLIILADTLTFSPTLAESCNAIDKEALLEFKRGIEYDSLGQLRTWNPKTDCCTSWNKVICDATTGRVIQLAPFRPTNPMDLDISVFVNGTISPFLGNLTYLEELDLGHFQQFYLDRPAGLRGRIPPQLGKLSRLTYLSLVSNILSGSIPTSLADLRRLGTLNLGYNRLSGSIPNVLFQSMRSLTRLYLYQNNFVGQIPSSVVNLIALETLNLYNNSLSGWIPTSIGTLKNLSDIDLSYNKLTGRIPDTLSKLSKLTSLKLNHNKLTGPIPDSFGNLTQLQFLQLNNNALTGGIPSKVLNLSHLLVFDVSNNQLSGRIPPHSSRFDASSFSGNPGLCDAPLPPCNRISAFGKTLRSNF